MGLRRPFALESLHRIICIRTPLLALSPGTRHGPYEIIAPLGAGGRGEGYRAKDTRLGREVAVKSLRPLFQMNLLDADGQRILAVTPARVESSSIGLLLNWPALLDK